MRTYIAIKPIFLLIWCSGAAAAHAQTPTKQETISFIQELVPQAGTMWDRKMALDVSIDGQISIAYLHRWVVGNRDVKAVHLPALVSFRLADVNVSGSDTYISFKCVTGSCVKSSKETPKGGEKIEDLASIGFSVEKNKEDARRLLRAFEHLQKFYPSKKPLFSE
jgi:hypothetical protein